MRHSACMIIITITVYSSFDGLLPDACRWLDPLRLNQSSLALAACKLRTILFVTSQYVNLIITL